jgi:hypothetical protein
MGVVSTLSVQDEDGDDDHKDPVTEKDEAV